jgi:hypothetical protein
MVSPPGGVPTRLEGSPVKLRYVWRDTVALIDATHRLHDTAASETPHPDEAT